MTRKVNTPYTQEQIDKRVTELVCFDCGYPFIEHLCHEGVLTVATFRKGICCLCLEEKSITHIRNYNNLQLK